MTDRLTEHMERVGEVRSADRTRAESNLPPQWLRSVRRGIGAVVLLAWLTWFLMTYEVPAR